MKKLNRIILCVLSAAAMCVAAQSCNPLTDEAKEVVGNYYIKELSDDVPIMELNDNGKAIYRTIKPEVLTISAEADWNVVGDSLIFDIKKDKVTFDGDSSLVGNIPNHISKKIVAHDAWTLTLEQSGVHYVYYRRNK